MLTAQKDISVPEQFKEIKAYAARENITILRDFADRERSAYQDDVKREEFEGSLVSSPFYHCIYFHFWG